MNFDDPPAPVPEIRPSTNEPPAVPGPVFSTTPLPMSQGKFARTRRRRVEDQDLNVLLARSIHALPTGDAEMPTDPHLIQIQGVRVTPWSGATTEAASQMPAEDTVFLLDLGNDEAVLVAGAAVRRIPRGSGGQDLVGRAARGATVWRQERLRTVRRAQLPEQLVGFAEQLNRSRTEGEVCRTLIEYAPRIVGGYTAAILLPSHQDDTLEVMDVPEMRYELRNLRVPMLQRLFRSGLITREDARADTGSPFAGLSPLFDELDAALVAHVPFGENGVLMLIERRTERVLEPEDWDLLGTLSRQADAALQRVHLFQEVHNLSLADPLTGLANRRQLDLVLQRGLAAARRGEGLAVVMLDLDGFKEINDQQGHLAGDRILVNVAEVLRREARGADLVVRYGGDEFLVVLPGSDTQGASAFVRRVRERLADQMEFSAGVAEYSPEITTGEQIIEAADRNLYLAKQHRRQWSRS